jgi:predicted CoA-binding protein
VDGISRLPRDPATTVAVVGATGDPAKPGAKIYRGLKGKGFTVCPFNPARDTVDGDPTFSSLADISNPPTIVNPVVPPQRTSRILEQCKELGLANVWVQPGADSAEFVDYLEKQDFTRLVNECITVRSRELA